VVSSAEARAELEELHPDGIEIELSEEALAEEGINLGVKPERLQDAYLELSAQALLPASGMVELVALEAYLDAALARETPEDFPDLTKGVTLPADAAAADLLRKIRSEPPMTEGQQAGEVYRRLNRPGSRSKQDTEEG
jgi:hypothetical protein